MATTQQKINQCLRRFSPINQVNPKYHRQLLGQLQLQKVKLGETIIHKSQQSQYYYFLIEGMVELRHSFDARHKLNADAKYNNQALPTDCTVKASQACLLVKINRKNLEKLLTQSHDYGIYHVNEGELVPIDDELIDDSYQQGWDTTFISSTLAAQLPSNAIYQLMSALENINVRAGDTIIKHHSQGDYFYLVKQGIAQVKTHGNGPFKGELFQLGPGSYFGDEALVATTIRNASVTMLSDGLLGRLNSSDFNQLIKPYLISPLSEAIDLTADNIKILDVRFSAEYKQQPTSNSQNIPISVLRKRMGSMQQSQLYLITPTNDSRSELATYIMRQAGFKAYPYPSLKNRLYA